MVAFSTKEVEYMAATYASKEAVWLQILGKGIGFNCKKIRLESNSQSAICLAKNPMYHVHTKHVDVQYHFVQEMVESWKVLIEKVDTLIKSTNYLMKPGPIDKFPWCRKAIGLE